mmetsp:Transcript_9439/g.10886  ORF Transcript_9439/g.10886 Transcript_9439/m.10886 type:complete len:86 (+) Transcript_9439:248-505(+)
MLVEVGEIVLILVPLCYIDDDNSWSEILLSDIPKQEILSPNRLFLDGLQLYSPTLRYRESPMVCMFQSTRQVLEIITMVVLSNFY